MQEDALHAQGVGHLAGMLATGAAEATQGVFGHVVAAMDGDFLDRAGHVLDRDGEEAFGHCLGGLGLGRLALDLGGELGEFLGHGLRVEGFVLVRPEDLGELLGQQLADHQVGVGHRQRPAPAIAGRARIGARRARPDPHSRPVEGQDRAAARRNGMDAHHRRAHAHPGDLGHEGALILAVVVRHIGRGAAHIEGDQPLDAGHGARLDGADNAARRAGQDAVLALEQGCLGEPAVGLHEQQPAAAEFGRDPVHIAPQDRRQIGVDHGGVAPADQLHQGADQMRDGYLGEADLFGNPGRPRLVIVIAVAVHEDDGRRADAVAVGRRQVARQTFLV